MFLAKELPRIWVQYFMRLIKKSTDSIVYWWRRVFVWIDNVIDLIIEGGSKTSLELLLCRWLIVPLFSTIAFLCFTGMQWRVLQREREELELFIVRRINCISTIQCLEVTWPEAPMWLAVAPNWEAVAPNWVIYVPINCTSKISGKYIWTSI